MNAAVLNTISLVLMLLNVGLASFAAAAPQGALPWWVVAGFGAVNAVVHALPSNGISVVTPPSVALPPVTQPPKQ